MGQTGMHDNMETVDSVWISPQEAIRQSEEGEFQLMAVTLRQLQTLAKFKSVDALRSMLESERTFEVHRPTVPAQ